MSFSPISFAHCFVYMSRNTHSYVELKSKFFNFYIFYFFWFLCFVDTQDGSLMCYLIFVQDKCVDEQMLGTNKKDRLTDSLKP